MPMPSHIESFAERCIARNRPDRRTRVLPGRAGEIGPVRKEIIFEPLPQRPGPAERPDGGEAPRPRPPVPEPVPAR